MISLNLLPDIKREYLKSQRVKRIFILVSMAVSAVAIALVVLLGSFVFGVQQLHLARLQDDIDGSLYELQQIPELDKVVTVQNQLVALPGLHDGKPATDRLFGYFSTLVPEKVSLSKVTFDFNESTAELNGVANSTKSVNIFVDTLKNATLIYDDQTEPMNPFTSVVVDSIAVDDGEIIYRLSLTFDPVLFDNTIENPQLSVPNITTSPSVTERPDLFQQPDTEDN